MTGDIRRNIESLRARMERACERCGRDPASVRLMAVSKFVETARMAEAIDCGIRLFGENRAQELHEKQTFFENSGCTVHFIGQLQTNKIKYVCGFAETVESVDRLRLAEGLSARARALGCTQGFMIQVNIGGEPQKGGVSDADLVPFAHRALACGQLELRGLMCVPPALEPEAARPYFRRMRGLFEALRAAFPGQPLRELSMGMSHDFETAIEEGATIVRVGTGIFGVRHAGI
ncbi:MAG: YggS family pyridoxal phosphate-dependent enzyme [Clostridia bacterium]|nr:YggS family pyridoxal phosphate-dependent enzyme [Clostridia bacterium]